MIFYKNAALRNISSYCHSLLFSTTFVQLFRHYLTFSFAKETKEARRRRSTKQNGSKPWVKIRLIPRLSKIYSILGELKYRVLYIGLVAVSLLLLLYLNIGLYLEFQSSYYLTYYQFIDFNWSEGIKELNQNNVSPNESTAQLYNDKEGLVANSWFSFKKTNADLKSVGTPIGVETDEFKFFFISIVTYFSEQIKFLINFSGNPPSNIFAKSDTSQQLVFSVYIMFFFYQLAAFLGYHIFCFLCPAVTKQFRLKLFLWFEIIFLILLLHFLALPYVLTIYQEFQIENLDSELFFSAQFDFMESWIKCFYFLLMVMILIALIIFFLIAAFSARKGLYSV